MKHASALPGTGTSGVEVTSVLPNGFWLMLGSEAFFVPFALFPWFRDAPLSRLANVTRPQAHHLYWPDLDIDLDVESIRCPENFSLVAQSAKR